MLQKSGRLVLWEAMFILELHSAETQGNNVFFLPRLPSAVPGILRHFPCRSILDTDGRKNVARFLKKKNANGTVLSNSP